MFSKARRASDQAKHATTVARSAQVAGVAAAAAAEVQDALVPEPDHGAAAFFDVDNTMIVGASFFYFAKGLAQRKFFTTGDVLTMAWQQAKFRIIGSEDRDDIDSSRERALAFVKGIEVARVVALGEEIYDETIQHKVYNGTRALAQLHQDVGQRVWLVTATPIEVASTIANRLHLTGALATVAESENGVYTGRLAGEMMHGPAKAEAIKALAEREGLDLARCTAYSDSVNDLPMLTLVGRAVAVNPDSDLRKEALARGWEIRDFRTGRKVAKISAIVSLAAGIGAGIMIGAITVYRRHGRYGGSAVLRAQANRLTAGARSAVSTTTRRVATITS
ncbi:MAG: HAD-IB family hydrolase [Antricoccus sp.]